MTENAAKHILFFKNAGFAPELAGEKKEKVLSAKNFSEKVQEILDKPS